jgi:acyl carrier protein
VSGCASTEGEAPWKPQHPPIETIVIAVIEQVLSVTGVTLDDDFLDLGGDSLSGLEVITQLQEQVGLALELDHLFENLIIRDLVAFLSAEQGPPAPAQQPAE